MGCWWGCGVLELYSLAYFSLLLVWPSRQGERFLIPLLPIFLFFTLRALLQVANWARIARERSGSSPLIPGPSALLALLVVAYGGLGIQGVYGVIREERQEPYYQGDVGDYVQAILWIRDHTPADAVVMTDRAPWAYLLSGRVSFTSPWVSKPSEAIAFMEDQGVEYIIANDWGLSGPDISPVLSAYPERFLELQRFGSQVIFAVQPLLPLPQGKREGRRSG